MSKVRGRTINRYYEAILELTSRPHKLYVPKRGEKREAFEYTGQKHLPRFTKAIIGTPDDSARYTFGLDKYRPKGSRFTVTNRRTRERSWHIPAHVFLDENEHLYDSDIDIDPEFFRAIIEEYAVKGQVYMIEAGDFHMWGDSGEPAHVAKKLATLFKQYGAGNFDPFDRNSHFIGNWFRGIQVFGQDDAVLYHGERQRFNKHRTTEWGLRPQEHFRELRSGDIAHFYRGKIIHIYKRADIPRLGAKITATSEHGVIVVENDDTS